MHTAFTGNTRKPRQVNLSGRKGNPWASLPGASSSPQAPTGSQNALAQAQAERARRAHDRDRLNAARKVQRLWRGHSSRTQQKQKWRDEWDANEQSRVDQGKRIPYQDTTSQNSALPYQDEEALRYQMRLVLSFLDTHESMDRWRLCYFGKSLTESWKLTEDPAHALVWNQYFTKLSRISARAIAKSETSAQRSLLLDLGVQILEKPVQLDHDAQFRSLAICSHADHSSHIASQLSKYIQALLLRKEPAAYDAFVRHLLSSFKIQHYPQMVAYIAIKSNQILFCKSVQKVAQNLPTEGLLWVLANTIYMWRALSSEGKEIDWISAISEALTRCANDVAARIDIADQPMKGTTTEQNLPPLNDFTKYHIGLLAGQQSVQEVMRTFRSTSITVAEVAKPLANYAVALLRAFPSRATNIRMWLYQNSPSSASGTGATSTIQYLWKASQSTTVFQLIRKDQEDVISVLTQAKRLSNQLGYQPPSAEEVLKWQEEWRIVLLFLELYTFILKLMDDEEFFALDEDNVMRSSLAYQFRQGALSLPDVASLGNFLKHLAFSLYWNAADLAEYNEVEDTASISVLFGQSPGAPSTTPSKPAAKTLAGNDVSQAYMKGLATGLLRMLYERDSRRKFLPDNYWLMTKHFDMQGFIPAVVAEEERRHEAVEDGDDEEELELGDEVKDDNDMHIPTLGSLFNIRAPHTPRSQASRQADTKLQEMARKRRQLQSLNPRLELLRNLPFFIPFDTRVQIFRRFIYRDQERRRNGYVEADDWRMSIASTQARDLNGRHRGMDMIGRHHADIHRGSVFEDAFDSFYGLGEELKEPIQISFIDQFGQPEAGIDGGGVTKEFLMSVTSEAFDPQADMPLFEENEQRYLYPKPTTMQQAKYILMQDGNRPGTEGFNVAMRGIMQRYEFLGRIVGKCMYEGILIDVNFAGFFLLKWALTGGTTSATTESSFRASINDLRDFDDQLYQGLLKLKNYPGDVEADFGLNFTVSDTFDVDGKAVSLTTDLIPGGSNELVTNRNRLKYIDRIVRYRLQEQPRLITNAFLKGLGNIISPMWLAMFNQKELQKLVGGDNQELDILDLRRNTQYGGLYVIGDDGLEHPTVAMFWKVLKELDDGDRRKVLKFVTSTPRAPLLGFSHLNPKFSIRDSSEDTTRLPSTSTCVNLLKLPRYGDERTMREKLLYAVNSGAGFDLS
ncbi:ubiquitin-protein ligase (E3) [Knufia obscura]|uniref:HECT-type E3 ubiquitin transferase n=2 Tax=Knufia TaxID=430999 RepID=A0AAN8I1U6_9EURO|nr:ubiquitin-protein ligase (E3) [Knufia obscura]KAK5949952.1 ubiquitin-protein ligase (E3) [Knufia fluminis]